MVVPREFGYSQAASSSFPVLPTPLEEKDSMVLNAIQVSTETGSSQDRDSTNFQFISQLSGDEPSLTQIPREGALLTPVFASDSFLQHSALLNHQEHHQDTSRRQGSFGFPAHIPRQNALNESITQSIDDFERTNDQAWREQYLSSVDDSLDSDLFALLADVDTESAQQMLDPIPDFIRNQTEFPQHSTVLPGVQSSVEQPSGVQKSAASPLSAAAKSRMRWTQELHEKFVDAVDELGGSDRATPKGVLRKMKLPGLTIYQVKSHLQKYRIARWRPEASEEPSEKKSCSSIQDIKPTDLETSIGITEALRLQMELQKHLHEQLESQRKLQLQIEEQGRYLQMVIEKQQKMQDDPSKDSSSALTEAFFSSANPSLPANQ